MLRLVPPAVLALLLLPGTAAAAPVELGPERNHPAGDLPYAVETADLDGDGVLDIVSPNTNSGDVSVLRGRGDGTFAPARTFPGGPGPRSAATADVDRDGHVDVVVTNVFGRSVAVLRGDGRGGLGPPERHAVGEQPRTVLARDLDRDGQVDLAVVDRRDDRVSVLLGRGDGGFAPAVAYPAGARTPGGDGDAYDVDALDADRDGTLDLAVAGRESDDVTLLLGRGDGTFRPGSRVPTGRSPYDVAAADLDGDGTPDLAVANGETEDVSVLLGRGDGTFAVRPRQPAGGSAFALDVADVDRDGDADLAVAINPNTPYVATGDYAGTAVLLTGRGDGTFGAPRSFGVGPRPVAIAAEDLDRDGRVELATANRGSDDLSVLRGVATPVRLRTSRRRVAWPQAVTLRGRLRSAGGASQTARRVVLEHRPWVRAAFTRVPGQPPGGVRVAADGTFALAGVRPEWTTDYRAAYTGDARGRGAATSALATTEQRVRVRLRGASDDLRLGRARTVRGVVSHHSHAGMAARLEVRRDGVLVARHDARLRPRPATRGRPCAADRDALCAMTAAWLVRTPGRDPVLEHVLRPTRPGRYEVRASFHGHPPGHLGSRSRAVRFRVVR